MGIITRVQFPPNFPPLISLLGPWETSLISSGVKNIINTIVYELNKNETRRFSYAEMGYLKRWMDEYGEQGYDTIKNLVMSGKTSTTELLTVFCRPARNPKWRMGPGGRSQSALC